MKEFKNFIRMTILGGFFVILPFILFIYFCIWIIEGLIFVFEPLSKVYEDLTGLDIVLCHLLSFSTFIFICFFIGVFVKTQFGLYIHYYFELLLKKIPGYSIVNDILNQFFGKDKKSFRKVLLIDRLNNNVYETAFLTDEYILNGETYYSVFIPTGPNPTSGFIVHITKDKIIAESTKIDKAMKSIVACGSGSSNIWSN